MTDPVHRPSHYTAGAVECIDAIEAALGREGFIAFLRGQVIKYQWRLGLKDAPEQDAAKAHWYSTRLQAVLASSAAAVDRGQAQTTGWVNWTGGGGMPALEPQTVVDVRLRNGALFENYRVLDWVWTHDKSPNDVVAYRVAR